MKVRATQKGFYGLAIRNIGDVFDIDDKTDAKGKVLAFSKRWMEKVVDVGPGAERTPEPAAKPVVNRDVI